ncbi:hypothetical protein [Pandoraea iniqua]|nr:hypothetical protein [Pandoraea iniqua]
MAWTLLLVANVATLALPTHAAVPRPAPEAPSPPDTGPALAWRAASVGTALPALPAFHATEIATTSWPDVVIRPLIPDAVKTDYSVDDILKAIASGNAPFRNLGESIADAYTALTGNDVSTEVREKFRKGTLTADLLTGMLPSAALSRLSAEVAQILADQHAGKPVESSRLIAVLLNTNLRGMESPSRQGAVRHTPANNVRPLAARELAHDPAGEPAPAPASETLHTPIDTPAFALPEIVTGEREHLTGYAQPLPENVLHSPMPAGPEGPDTLHGIIVADGNYFIRGTGGYYRMQRQKTGDHWLIDAHEAGKPQIPVIYDTATGKWRAHAPLRLCGGGCGSSKSSQVASNSDSMLGMVFDLSSIREPEVRRAIQESYDDLSELRLLRTNRDDLRPRRDNSIVEIRESLSNAMRRIDRHAPLLEQQRQAARCTALYYLEHPASEAFCQENAEVLFHFMLANQVPASRIRMITLRPRNRPPHVMVLYTESKNVIQMLHWATPQPAVDGRIDGITDLTFAQEIYATRASTRLLDPWGRIKMQSFERARCEHEVLDTLRVMLEDAGARNGEAFFVSITRPLGTPRTSSTSLSSPGGSSPRSERIPQDAKDSS